MVYVICQFIHWWHLFTVLTAVCEKWWILFLIYSLLSWCIHDTQVCICSCFSVLYVCGCSRYLIIQCYSRVEVLRLHSAVQSPVSGVVWICSFGSVIYKPLLALVLYSYLVLFISEMCIITEDQKLWNKVFSINVDNWILFMLHGVFVYLHLIWCCFIKVFISWYRKTH